MSEGLIILLCRNALPLAKPCLKSLQRQTHPCRTLIIDNAGPGVPQWARAEQHKDPGVFVMTFAEPQSVSKCWNEGLKWAWRMGYGEALVVNDDTELLPCTYDVLRRSILGGRYAIWRETGKPVGMITCVSRREDGEVFGVEINEPFNARPHPDFSCYMLARWAYEKVGEFDEGMVGGYCEDNDYHVRMHQAGVQAICIDLPFLHHACGTMKYASEEEKRQIESNAAKNRERFKHKYGCYPGGKKYEQLFC